MMANGRRRGLFSSTERVDKSLWRRRAGGRARERERCTHSDALLHPSHSTVDAIAHRLREYRERVSIDRPATMMRSNLPQFMRLMLRLKRRITPFIPTTTTNFPLIISPCVLLMEVALRLDLFGGEFDQALAPVRLTSHAHSEHSCFRLEWGRYIERTQPPSCRCRRA
jgi:hypothetical protein